MLSALVIFSLLVLVRGGQRCSAATSISVDQGYYDKNNCGEYTRQQLCGGASGASMWYALYLPLGTPSTNYVVSAAATSTSYQLQVALYNSCQDSSYFACNYSSSSSQPAALQYYLDAGRYYYVQVTTLGDYSVDFGLSVYSASSGPPAAWENLGTCLSTDMYQDWMDLPWVSDSYTTPASDCPLSGYDPDCYNENWKCFNDCFSWSYDNWEDFDQCEYYECLTDCYAAPECKEIAEYYCCVYEKNIEAGKYSEDSYECVNVGCPETRMNSVTVFVIITFVVLAVGLLAVIAIICFIRLSSYLMRPLSPADLTLSRRNLRPKYTITGTDAQVRAAANAFSDAVTVVYPGSSIQE